MLDLLYGELRMLLNTLEMAVSKLETKHDVVLVTQADVLVLLTKKALLYDKNGEEHYNLICALHKCSCNSDVELAIYWLARMLEAGEDPLYIARRLVWLLCEDVGMADRWALEMLVSVYVAAVFIGSSEATVHLTQLVTYLCLLPKSKLLYTAYGLLKKDATETLAEPVSL